MKRYNQALHYYEKAVNKFKADLDYLESNDKVSDKFIAIQKALVRSLEEYSKIADDTIIQQSQELANQAQNFSNELERKSEHILCLEALLIIHGVYDLDLWLKKGVHYLVKEAKEYYQNAFVHIPSKQLELLEKRKDPLLNLLDVRQCNEIEMLENEVAALKKKLKDGKRRKKATQETLDFRGV